MLKLVLVVYYVENVWAALNVQSRKKNLNTMDSSISWAFRSNWVKTNHVTKNACVWTLNIELWSMWWLLKKNKELHPPLMLGMGNLEHEESNELYKKKNCWRRSHWRSKYSFNKFVGDKNVLTCVTKQSIFGKKKLKCTIIVFNSSQAHNFCPAEIRDSLCKNILKQ